MFRRPLSCTSVVLLAWATAGLAQKEDVTIDSLQLGTPVLGPKLAAEDMKGKVVVVEFWGIN